MIERIQQLLKRYQDGDLTDIEIDELYNMISELRDIDDPVLDDETLKVDLEKIKASTPPNKRKIRPLRLVQYAAVTFLFTFFLSWVTKQFLNSSKDIPTYVSLNDKPAGSFKAYLKTQSGNQYIPLDSTNVSISHVLDKYSSDTDGSQWQTLHTPKGTEFKIELEDKSILWVKPGSIVRFPSHFSDITREVHVQGEILLEVSPDAQRPFYVHTQQQTIEVLGTTFNVSSTENRTTTTLIEGSVLARNNNTDKSIIIKPGESIVSENDRLYYTASPIEEILAWRDGFFFFEKQPLQNILERVADWYDVEIESGNLETQVLLSGRVSKYMSLMEFTKIITMSTDITCELKDNKLVLNKN